MSSMADNATSIGIYAGTLGMVAIAMVNPKGDKGLAHEWKALTLFGIIPSMLKLASMTGQAQLSTTLLLITCGVTMVVHLLLRELSKTYKKAFKQPSEVKPGEAFASWLGIIMVYSMVMFLGLSFFTNKYNAASTIKPSPSLAAPPAGPPAI